ncbi:MAG TPA: GMC family oxidoreductase N-terminal domain-containing protein [Ramlibacter sp.]|nr:GMC family oxidoreductase N-terminal domain-containing protein [Ramlibacter sp.]
MAVDAMGLARAAGEFDYVVVGAGAAGCIVAARLSEDPGVTVCLLEAGPSDRHPFLRIPGGFKYMVNDERYTWQFQTEPTPFTGNRSICVAQGRTLGGSTSVNGMIFNRGQATDFDSWRAAGNPGWSYEDVLPYYRSIERRAGGDPTLRGDAGELVITDTTWKCPTIPAFVAAAGAHGLEANADYNGASQAGVAVTQQNIHRGWRLSTSAAFLGPALRRPNLDVRVNARADRILFEGQRAVGVAYTRRGEDGASTVRARCEVIVCSGAINTPRLLQVSGLGAPAHLQELGVPVVRALPGVGENLADHYMTPVIARGRGFLSINEVARGPRLWAQVARWLAGRPSLVSMSPVPMHFFFSSGVSPGEIDLQGTFTPANYKPGTRELDDRPGLTCVVWQHRPRSRGHVRARSRDMDEAPLVQPNYLAQEHDRQVVLAGLRFCRQLLGTQPLSQYVEGEIFPGPQADTDEALLAHAFHHGSTAYHVMGTAKMGPASDPLSVVDHELRVHGVGALRVVDASVMPFMPSANTSATTMMIGEKAAALIRQRA